MPGKVKVKIISGRNLPVMDRSSDTTDAYVEIKLGTTTFKTDVCRKSLHPQWNSEWYRFELDDAELQDEPLQIRLMDHDTYSANDAIGKVYLDLNPLLLPVTSLLGKWNDGGNSCHEGNSSVMSGWIPVYDTMHGIRGEVNVVVKVELFTDFNKFRQSSCGVQFFCSPAIPHGFYAQVIHGFVEELVVNDDPEYQWIDKIRTPRASNEARQTLFCKLSGELQRRIGLKALEMGGNAVIGYNQCFDLEGESGIVARGIGTAVSLVKIMDLPSPSPNNENINDEHVETTPVPLNPTPTAASDSRNGENGHQRTESLGVRIAHSPAKLNAIPCIHRRSSDSDLSITPKGNSLTGSDRSGGYSSGQYMRGAMLRTTRPQENFDIMEYPFLTLSKYPPGFIAHIGGSVSARSVKLLERITNLEEPESRDTWWSEIRMEIRSHARALNCNAVLGYTESTSICDDVCVLSASGTAAVLGFQHTSTTGESADNVGGLPILPKNNTNSMTTSLDRNDFEKDKDKDRENKEKPKVEHPTMCTTKPKTVPTVNGANTSPERESTQHLKPACSITHLPYVSNSKPLRSSSIKCCTCGAYKVPDMLIATIEIPEGMPNFGRGCFIQSYVCRPLKDLKGESNAKEISDGLPFLEYELHRFLINKLKVKGMNAIFGLKVRISIGERMLIGIATGTAVFLSSLPPPLLPKLVSDRTTDEKKLTQLQKDLHDTIKRNREIYQLRSIEEVNGESNKLLSESDGSEDETPGLDLAVGNKDCCILEVDDPDDADVLKSVLEPRPPDGFHVVNTEHVPGLEDLEIVKNLQMFTQIWRAKIPPPFDLDKHFHRLLQSVYFKLRRMIPCALCDLQFRVDSPEPDEIQLCVVGMALGLGDPLRNAKKRKTVITKRVDDDLIFNLEEDQIPEHSVAQTPPTTHLLQTQSLKHRQKSPIRNKLLTKQRHVPYRERHGVDITPLSYVPGGKIEKYLGNLNFFFIRETTSLREEGGLSGFVHSFVTEILAIVRAHVTALGGNAMVAYFITECVLNHNLHKNQGQCLINVGGDVVYVSYFTEDH